MAATEKDVSIRVFTESMHLVRLVLCCVVLLGANPVMAADGLARENGVRLLQACRAANELVNGEALVGDARVDAALCIGFVEGFVWGQGWKA